MNLSFSHSFKNSRKYNVIIPLIIFKRTKFHWSTFVLWLFRGTLCKKSSYPFRLPLFETVFSFTLLFRISLSLQMSMTTLWLLWRDFKWCGNALVYSSAMARPFYCVYENLFKIRCIQSLLLGLQDFFGEHKRLYRLPRFDSHLFYTCKRGNAYSAWY